MIHGWHVGYDFDKNSLTIIDLVMTLSVLVRFEYI